MLKFKKSLVWLLVLCLALVCVPFAALASEGSDASALAEYVVLPDGMDESAFGTNTVTDGVSFYATLQAATQAIADAGTDGAVLYCKPGSDVGSLQHAPVVKTLTVYGNGAYVSGGAERDFDIGNTDPSGGKDITSDVTLTVKYLDGCGAWGTKATDHTVNLVFENCSNMGKVFITGTTGVLNIKMNDCAFEGVIKEAVYSNANGTIELTKVDFSNLNKAINLNHKVAGEQKIVLTDCSFTNCGNDVSADQIPVRVLSSVEGGSTALTVSGCTFSGTPEGGADILLDYGVGTTETSLSDTAANVTVEYQNNVATEKNVSADETVSVGNVVRVAYIGEQGYATLAEALAAASAMTGDVTIEILDKVTLNQALSGSYDSIKFVGKDTDAEIYLDVQGYITASGKKVAFEDLKLSKVAGGYITNAGFMNLAFGVYDVVEVTYTDCILLNGAYASSGTVIFDGCTFYRSHDKYGLWAYGDVDVVVDGCKFDDYRGIKMYAEGGAKTVDLTVKNTDFTNADNKPAIVLTYGASVTLEGNTYSAKGVFELDLDGAPNGTTVTSDVPPTCVNDNGACGVLVDGKIYTTVAQAAEVATSGSTVTLLHNSAETVEFATGVALDKNGFTAAGVTVKAPVAIVNGVNYESVIDAILAAIESGATEVKILSSSREVMPFDVEFILKADLTITADAPVDVKFYNNGTSFDFVIDCEGYGDYDFTIAENVNFVLEDRVIWVGYYGSNIDVIVNGSMSGYQIWIGGDVYVNATGTLKSSGEAMVLRRGKTLFVDGGKVVANYFNILSGNIFAENGAEITCGAFWIANTGSYIGEGNVSISIWDSKLTSSGNLKSASAHAAGVTIDIYNSEVVFADFDGYGASQLDASSTLWVNGEDTSLTIKSLTNNGTVEIFDDASLAFTGAVTNNGDFIIAPGCSLKSPAEIADVTVDSDDYIAGWENGELVFIESVAKIGEQGYATLQDAINAAQTGDVIVIIDDIELVAQNAQALFKPAYNRESYCGIYIPDDLQIAIDLNGHTISYVDVYGDVDNVMILNLGHLTINDSATGGKITYKPVAGTKSYTYFYSTIFNCGTLIINGGVIENTCDTETDVSNAVDNHSRLSHEYGNDCILEVNGGSLIGAYYYAVRQYTHYLEGVKNRVTINDGTIYGGIYMQHGDSWYYADAAAKRLNVDCFLTINGGTITKDLTPDDWGKIKSRLSNPDNNSFGLEINGGIIEVPVELLVQRGYYYENGVSGALAPTEAAGARNDEWLTKNGGFITGGTFTDLGVAGTTTDLSQFLAEGLMLVENSDGTFGIEEAPKGNLNHALTSNNTIWGEAGGNAKESYVIKIYSGDTYMGYTSLNNIDGILNGNVFVTWHIKLDAASNTDEYWTMAWDIAPSLACQPTRVEQWIDGVKVAEANIQLSGSDNLWQLYVAAVDENGIIKGYYETIAAALNAGATKIAVLRDVTESIEELTGVTLLNGAAGGVTITNTYTGWTSLTNVTIGNGVTFVTKNALFDDAGVNVIEGTVHTTTGGTFYNAYDSKTTVQNGGKIVADGMIVNRYHYNADSGIYVYGDGDDSTVEVYSADTIGTYSGIFYAKDATIEGNMLWIDYKKDSTEEADKYHQSLVYFEDSTVSITKEFRLYKDASLKLEGATVTAGTVQVRQDATPTIDIDSATSFKANEVLNLDGAAFNAVLGEDGTVSFKDMRVVQIGDQYYPSLEAALAAAQAGDVIVIIKDLSGVAVTADKSLTIKGNVTLNNVSISGSTGIELTVEGLSFTGNSWINANGAAKLTVKNVTADVTPSNASATNSRSAFISLGRSEQATLELYVEGCSIISRGGSDPILGWAAITKADLIGNTFGSADAYQEGSDSVKFMSIADGAVFNITGNTVYSNYNGIVFGQNTTRGNAYTVCVEGNTFIGGADHIWLEVSGATTCHATIVVKGGNTINGNAFKASDIKTHPNLNTFTGYLGVGVESNADGKLIGGSFAKAPDAALIASGYEAVEADGVFVIQKILVAEVNGVKYGTLREAIDVVADGGTIVLLRNIVIDTNTREWNSGTWYDGIYIKGDKSFTLDLAGYTITQDGSVNDYLINFINQGDKANTITIKNGTIDAANSAFCALCTSASSTQKITINLEGVKLINNISNGSTAKIRGGAELNVKAGTVITGKNSYLAIECVGAIVNIYDGAELYMNGTGSYNGCLVGVCYGGVVNVYGGYGKGVKGGFIAMTSGGTINVYGGEWIANTDGSIGDNSNLYVLTAQNNADEGGYVGASIINVYGGVLRGGMDAWILHQGRGEVAELNIFGGNFNANPTRFVENEYVAVQKSDSTYDVVKAVAKIGTTYYATIQAAINAAQNGDVVTILPGEYSSINISNKNITIQGTVGANGELLTTIKGGNPAITGHGFNGTIKDLKIVDAWKVMYAEPAGNVTIDNVYVTGATYGFHLVAYSEGLTWTIQNSYMDLRWANSFGVYGGGDAAIVITGNIFEATNPYYDGGDVLHVNSFLPNVTVTENVFGENAKIRMEVTDTSKINISKNYHADGVDNAFSDDSDVAPIILEYYKDEALTELVTRVAKIGDVDYATLEEALAAIRAGETLTLLADVTLTEKLTLPAGIILNGNGKQINGEVWAGGDLTFVGHTKVTNFNAGYEKPTITIGAGACLELTGSGRMVIGHGATFNITGTITDAKTANVAELQPSLIAAGASFTGAGVNFNVTNAYVKFTAYCSSKNSNANNTFNFNVTNSIWEQTGSFVFTEPTSGKDPTFNLNLKDSVLNSTSHLVFAVTKGEIVIDNSNVNVGNYRQLENRSTLTIKNGSVVYASVQTSSNAKNPGTTIVENATYMTTGEFSGSDVGTGTLIIKKDANVTMGKITKANIVIDAAGMKAGEITNFTANLSGLTGTVSVVNNNKLDAKIVDGKIVLFVKPVAQIGEVQYETLQDAINAAQSGDVIVLLENIEATVMPTADTTNNVNNCFILVAAGKTVVLDLNGKTISVTGDSEALYDTLAIRNHGNLTINDSVGGGKITFTYSGNKEVGTSQIHSTILNFGTLTVNGGTIENLATSGYGRYAIYNYSWGGNVNLTVNGGTITNATSVAVYIDGYSDFGGNSCNATINGGTFNGGVWYNGRTTTDGKNFVINGGTFNAGAYAALTIRNVPYTASITGGIFNGEVSITDGVKAITGGTFSLPVAEAACAEGYIPTLNADGTYGVKVGKFVARNTTTGVGYETLEEALAAAVNGDVITLIWNEGDAPIAMNGAVFGKTVTITGTATVDWSKGFLFIGRGGEGNGTVIFDNANLTSASNSASYGIHVSGREKGTNNKYDGTLEIKNSVIELDYLINKGNITLDNATLTVKNGFAIGGRPASETESGEDATATITLNNGSKLVVNNHNGMGLGYEAIGVMNVNAGSTFECKQSFLVTAKGTMNVYGTVKVAGTLTNKGAITLADADAKLFANEGVTIASGVEGYFVKYVGEAYVLALAVAEIDGVPYASLEEALNAAVAGDIVKLLADATYDGILMLKGITLDLDGKTLAADGVIALKSASIVDTNETAKGLLKVADKDMFVMSKADYPMLPVWNEDGNGFFFVNVKAQAQLEAKGDDSFKVIYRPSISGADIVNKDIFGDGALDNDLVMKINILCIKEGAVAETIGFVLSDELIAEIYSAETNKAVHLTIFGATDMFDAYQIEFVIESASGISFSEIFADAFTPVSE